MGSADQDFAEFFAARCRRLQQVGFALCGDWLQAEELTQATFVRLYRHWGKVSRGNPDAYARRVLTNLYLDRARRNREVLRDVLPDPVVGGRGHADDVAAHVDVGRMLDRLAPRMRAVVVLRFLEDLSVAEVAGLLGIAEGTVKSHCNRAMTLLSEGRAEVER
ncbi:MAG: SigE family RNA polymerase sigma factor [Nocardioidaceae bacterium]